MVNYHFDRELLSDDEYFKQFIQAWMEFSKVDSLQVVKIYSTGDFKYYGAQVAHELELCRPSPYEEEL